MSATKLRIFGGIVLLFNLWLIGHYNLQGIPVLLLTIGFAIGYELLIVRKIQQSEPNQYARFLKAWLLCSIVVGVLVGFMWASEGWQLRENTSVAEAIVRAIVICLIVGLVFSVLITLVMRPTKPAVQVAASSVHAPVEQPRERQLPARVNMGTLRKGAAATAIAALVIMAFFPPFQFRLPNGVVVNLGYAFIFSPPHYGSREDWVGTVDIPMLLVQWLGVAIITGAVWWLSRTEAT